MMVWGATKIKIKEILTKTDYDNRKESVFYK